MSKFANGSMRDLGCYDSKSSSSGVAPLNARRNSITVSWRVKIITRKMKVIKIMSSVGRVSSIVLLKMLHRASLLALLAIRI
jgi:hypothetical protein